MNAKYGIQGDGHNYGTPERPIQLFQVVDHSKPNAWGQSLVISGGLPQVEAQEAADRLNAAEELRGMWANRPEGEGA